MELFWHWLQVVSGAILVGSFLFPSARARKLACGAAFVFLLSGIGLLWLQTLAARAQGPAAVNVEELIAFATQTTTAMFGLLSEGAGDRHHHLAGGGAVTDAVTPLALGLLAQAITAAAGHSFAAEGKQWIAVPLHAVHVAASSLWLGGLGCCGRRTPRRRAVLLGALRRFSRLALALMAAILASGAVIAIVHVGRWPALFGTSGQTLLLKLALIAAVLAVAGNLRWRLLFGSRLVDTRRGAAALRHLAHAVRCWGWR
ncbi:MAG: CopD family protein [Gammaproteobacteria bacterium]